MCYVCWLLLVKLLARKTPLMKRLHGKEIISTKPRPKSVCEFLQYIVSLFYDVFVLSYVIFHTSMTRHRLLVLNVTLNTNQLTNSRAHRHLLG